MNVVCYGCPLDKTSRIIWENIQKNIPDLGLELHWSCESLLSRLCHPSRSNIVLTVLYIEDQEALFKLLSLRSLLYDLPVAIILTTRDRDVLRLSHEFRPRVIMDTDWMINDVCSVLGRCIEKSRKCKAANLPASDLRDHQRIIADDGKKDTEGEA